MNPLSTAKKPVKRVLGIDPGSRITGFGIVEQSGNHLIYVTSGCIRADNKSSLPSRLGVIFAGLEQVIAIEQPDESAIEQVFVNINPQSTLLLGQARGAAICALVDAGLPVSEYTALQIKQAVVGQGRASKRQIQHMVRRLLNLPGDPSPDAADALACAICHIHCNQRHDKLSAGTYRMRGGRLLDKV